MATMNQNQAKSTNSKKRKLSTNDENKEEFKNPISSNAIGRLHLSEKGADVHFIFRSTDERIPAHKVILAASSPVFDTAFFGSMPEKNEINVEDACADAYKEFLQFFYLKKIKLSQEHLQNVFYLCHKYQLDKCSTVCSEFLKKYLTIDQMCMGYQLAIHLEQDDLKEYCEREICSNAEQIWKSEGFLNCDWKILSEIVKTFEFRGREIDVLEACIDWARNSCKQNKLNVDKENIRNQLKDVIYDIRFNQISNAEFATYLEDNIISPYDSVELEDIIRIIGGKKINSTKFNCSYRFVDFHWNNSEIIKCQRAKKNFYAPYTVPKIIPTIFSSDKSLILGQIDIEYINTSDRYLNFNTSIERMDFGPEIHHFQNTFNERKLVCSGVSRVEIILPKPIVIEKNIKYRIVSDFSSNGIELLSCCSMNKNEKMKYGATITFHRDTTSNFDNVDRGVIESLYFNKKN